MSQEFQNFKTDEQAEPEDSLPPTPELTQTEEKPIEVDWRNMVLESTTITLDMLHEHPL